MSKILRTNYSDEYSQFTGKRLALREDNDCAVICLAVGTGISYEAAHDTFKRLGREHRRGVYVETTVTAFKEHGFELRRWSILEYLDMIHSYPGVHCLLKSITTHHPRRFAKQWATVGTVVLHCNRHILTCKNGTVHDWAINRAKRVYTVYQVVKI